MKTVAGCDMMKMIHTSFRNGSGNKRRPGEDAMIPRDPMRKGAGI
jgi:hypothetical protein